MSPLQNLLNGVQPTDAKETADLKRMQAFAAELPAPFSRAQMPAHFTGSALIVDPPGEQVCLVLHAKLQRWLQPGGHSNPEDQGDMLATALREAVEETALEVELVQGVPQPFDIDIHSIPANSKEGAHEHLDVRFLFRARNPEALSADLNESNAAQWVSFDRAITLAGDAAMLRMVTKARALLKGA